MATPARIFEMNELPGSFARQIRAGDVVRTGENRFPLYRVIATDGDKAWVRDVQYGTDHILEIGRLHEIEDAFHSPSLVEHDRRAHSRLRSR